MDFAVSVESAFSPMILRRKNTWYSINDGDWFDPNTWMGNGLDKKNYTTPQAGDDVVINNTVTYQPTIVVANLILNNVTVNASGTFKLYNVNVPIFQVLGSFLCYGTLDMNNANSKIYLGGVNNVIANVIFASTSTVVYNSINDQNILPLAYAKLAVSGMLNTNSISSTYNSTQLHYPTRYLTANTTISSTLVMDGCTFQLGSYNLTVTGATSFGGGVTLLKSGSGTVTFIGLFDGSGGGNNTLDFTAGNPNVELRGGFVPTYYQNGVNTHFKTGTGTWTFSTNSQNIHAVFATTYMFDCPIVISGAITVTVTNPNSCPIQFNNTINGDNAGSTLNNDGTIYLGSTSSPMSTGIFNYMHGGSTSVLGFVANSNQTLPYSTYGGLLIGGSGIKTLSGDTTASGILQIGINGLSASQLELSSFALSVTGTTTLFASSGITKNSSTGAVLFVGLLDGWTQTQFGFIDFSAGNPNVELRGGLKATYGTGSIFKTGTGTWKFSTNNQTITCGPTITSQFDCLVLISGAITVTLSPGSTGSILQFNGVINGDNAGSILDNRMTGGTASTVINNATAPMSTGKLYCNQAANLFIYGLAGNQDITVPTDPTNPGYSSLTLNGSGAKRLLGNVSVKGTYTLTPPATLNYNGFSLTNP